jgi:Protein of unknown function (DUF3455)
MTNDKIRQPRIAAGVLRLVQIAALAAIFAAAVPQGAYGQSVTPPAVPDDIQVEPPNQSFLVGHATGTQNYVCAPSRSIGQVAWALFTPQATLFDDVHEQLTTHFFGPNPAEGTVVRAAWEHSEDTSTVWGRVAASSTDPAFVSANAIPWLLVEIVGTQTGPTGGNALSGTTFIHRVNTSGGVAPSTGCALPTDIGNKAFVPYTADYFFYRR